MSRHPKYELYPTGQTDTFAPCIIEGCNDLQNTRSMCKHHYNNWQNHDDPMLDGYGHWLQKITQAEDRKVMEEADKIEAILKECKYPARVIVELIKRRETGQ